MFFHVVNLISNFTIFDQSDSRLYFRAILRRRSRFLIVFLSVELNQSLYLDLIVTVFSVIHTRKSDMYLVEKFIVVESMLSASVISLPQSQVDISEFNVSISAFLYCQILRVYDRLK